jgi:hypothetical protein
LDHVGGDGEIVVKELNRPGRIGDGAANLRGGNEDDLRARLFHPPLHLDLAGQGDVIAFDGDKLAVFRVKPPEQRRANHAAVSGDPDSLALEAKDLSCDFRHGRADLGLAGEPATNYQIARAYPSENQFMLFFAQAGAQSEPASGQ